jgi:hypothetical protein
LCRDHQSTIAASTAVTAAAPTTTGTVKVTTAGAAATPTVSFTSTPTTTTTPTAAAVESTTSKKKVGAARVVQVRALLTNDIHSSSSERTATSFPRSLIDIIIDYYRPLTRLLLFGRLHPLDADTDGAPTIHHYWRDDCWSISGDALYQIIRRNNKAGGNDNGSGSDSGNDVTSGNGIDIWHHHNRYQIKRDGNSARWELDNTAVTVAAAPVRVPSKVPSAGGAGTNGYINLQRSQVTSRYDYSVCQLYDGTNTALHFDGCEIHSSMSSPSSTSTPVMPAVPEVLTQWYDLIHDHTSSTSSSLESLPVLALVPITASPIGELSVDSHTGIYIIHLHDVG